MARRTCRTPVTVHQRVAPIRRMCSGCQAPLVGAYHTARTGTTLDSVCRLTLVVRRCHTPGCPRSHLPYRPEEAGAWAVPHGAFGLDAIARIGTLRSTHHHSVPDIHAVPDMTRGVVLSSA